VDAGSETSVNHEKGETKLAEQPLMEYWFLLYLSPPIHNSF
jgi:hypothetical protein